MNQNYKGSCHCGAIKFAFKEEPITKGLRCTCSLCSRKGSLMSPILFHKDELAIEAEEGMLGLYQFGIKTAKHYYCKNCGIYTFHETSRKPEHMRVNLGCVDGIDTFQLEVEIFDGKNLL